MTGVLITGPPRSGTSATARLLDLAGLHVCIPADRVGGGPNNPTGHWESKTVLAINNRLLDDAGVRWWCPPAVPLAAGATTPADASAFRRVHAAEPWSCKDPRFAVTLAHWRRALDDLAGVVVVLRRPDETVASLRRTWRLSVEHAGALWVRYLHLALSVSQIPVVIVRFPEVVEEPRRGVAAVAGALAGAGVALGEPAANAVEAFVRTPRGSEGAVEPLPGWTWEWWDALTASAGPAGPTEPTAVERVLGPLGDEFRAGRPIDTRPLFTSAAEANG